MSELSKHRWVFACKNFLIKPPYNWPSEEADEYASSLYETYGPDYTPEDALAEDVTYWDK